MASNFNEPGHVQEFTAPAGGVTNGVPLLIGSLVVVPTVSAAVGVRFNGALSGVWTLPKAAGAPWTEGLVLYFDSAAGNFATAASPTARRAGGAVAAAAAADATGSVRLVNLHAAVNVA
jgi:predicted RecA/RadA family phage recombinase